MPFGPISQAWTLIVLGGKMKGKCNNKQKEGLQTRDK